MAQRIRCWTAGLTIIILGVGVGLAADKPSGKQPKPKAAARAAPVLKEGQPAAHGLRNADLEAVRKILQKAVDNKKLPGVSLLLAHRGEVIFKEAFGDLKVDQVVELFSDSKPIAATAVMTIVDQGKMRLDDPLPKFVPEFKGTKVEKATVRQLLSHSSGIDDGLAGAGLRGNTLADFAVAVAQHGSLRAPGTFRYSTTGIDIACRCAEKAAGKPFEDLLRENVCEPLGMKNTGFARDGLAEVLPKEARERGEGRLVSGGGGLSSTLDDMAAFYQMHLNGGRYGDKEILSRKWVNEMHRRQAGTYGLGFFLSPPRIFHHGGPGTFCWGYPDGQFVGIFFSQGGLKESMPVRTAVQKKLLELAPAMR